jgi:hypothetical protein
MFLPFLFVSRYRQSPSTSLHAAVIYLKQAELFIEVEPLIICVAVKMLVNYHEATYKYSSVLLEITCPSLTVFHGSKYKQVLLATVSR